MKKDTSIRWMEVGILSLLNAVMVYVLATRTGFLYLDTSTHVELFSKFFHSPWVVYVVGGRFLPAMYVYFASWGGLFGFTPQSLLVGQFILYSLAALLVFWMMGRWGIRRRVKWVLYLLLFVQQTVAENLFTVGKSELFLFVSTTAVVALLYALMTKPFRRPARAGLFFALFLAFLCLILSKETSLSVLSFLCVLLFFSFFSFSDTQYRQTIWIACGLCVASILCFQWMRSWVQVADSGYVQVQFFFPVMWQSLKIYIMQCPDLFLYGTAALVLFLSSWMQAKRTVRLWLGGALAVWGWAYICMMLLWRYAVTYYMLFPASLFILSLSLLCAEFSFPLAGKWVPRLCCGLCALLLLINTQHFYYVAGTHIDLEYIYTESLRKLESYLTDGDVLYYEDGTGGVEPPVATSVYFNHLKQVEVAVIGLGASYGAGPRAGKQDPWRENNPQPGDFVVAYDNVRSNPAHIRAASPSAISRPEEALLERGVAMTLLEEDEVHRTLPNKRFLDIRWPDTYAGYRIYRVTKSGNPAHISGLMQDGWTEKEFWIRNCTSNQITLHLTPLSYQFFPENTLALEVDGHVVADILLTGQEEINLSTYLPMPEEGVFLDIRCVVLHTASELMIPLAGDSRDLGLHLSVSFGSNGK